MDSRCTMNIGVYSQYEDRIYNTSGVTTEHTELLHTMQTTPSENENFLFNTLDSNLTADIEFEDSNYGHKFENLLPDLEIIAVDPNCFYSSDEDEDINVEFHHDETNSLIIAEESSDNSEDEQVEIPFKSATITSSQSQTISDYSFDNLNITDLCAGDDNFLIEHHADDILFASNGKNDFNQFDLANYIGGEGIGSTLLLSPPPVILPKRKFTPLRQSPYNNKAVVNCVKKFDSSVVQPTATTSRQTLLNNRRKRKNLTREFIEDSSSDSETEQKANKLDIENYIDVEGIDSVSNKTLKKQRLKDDDPTWDPVTKDSSKSKLKTDSTKKLTKAVSEAVATTEQDVTHLKKSGKTFKSTLSSLSLSSSSSNQSDGLRTMLKKQMLSSQPMQKKLLTTNKATHVGVNKNANKSKTFVPNTNHERKIGLGRGKDISITAKYFNCTDSNSSDNSDRDNTDNDSSLDESSSDSDDEDHLSKQTLEQQNENDDCANDANESQIKTNNLKIVNEKRDRTPEPVEKSKSTKIPVEVKATEYKSNVKIVNGPFRIDNNSLDTNDFAKAIFVDVKNTTKNKQQPTVRRSVTDQVKLLQQPLILPRMNQVNRSIPLKELTSILNNSQSTNCKRAKLMNEVCAQPIKSVDAEVKTVDDNSSSADDAKMEIDVESIDEIKSEATVKKKLNVQEYLKRKNIKLIPNIEPTFNEDLLPTIKTESNASKTNSNAIAQTNEQSMYEEIIIVSMGCNTDISIPEASFAHQNNNQNDQFGCSNNLLSNIQTTIEKANSAMEIGKISSNSLISSIQDVILKKTTTEITAKSCTESIATDEINIKNGESESEYEHGENKVIMHLRKNRVRPATVSISIQTEPYFQFPLLQKLPTISRKSMPSDRTRCKTINEFSSAIKCVRQYSNSNQRDRSKSHSNRNYRSRKNLSESSYYSDEEQSSPQRRSRHSDFFDSVTRQKTNDNRSNRNGHYRHRKNSSPSNSKYRSSKYERNLNRHRTISRSLSQSSDTSNSSTDSTSSDSSASSTSSGTSVSSRSLNSYGGSSSKSYYIGDHYVQRRPHSNQSYRNRSRNISTSNNSQTPDERRIVYVGRIEVETTKEDLRRKFSVYGVVKNVSIHYKEMKWKYGFVTFERPADAYTAIDTCSKNPAIKDYDISFGGRRAFCREKYLDLDNTPDDYTQMGSKPKEDDSFEALLRKVKEKLQEAKQIST